MRKKTKGRIQRFEERSRTEDNQGLERPVPVEKKKKNIRINGSRLTATVIVAALIVVLLMSVNSIFNLRAEQKTLKAENEALLLEKESLQDELKNVSDKEYIEEQARIQLKLIKPGEILYILEDNKDKESNEKEDEKKD